MKKRYFLSILLAGALSVSAQLKVDPAGLSVIENYRNLLAGKEMINPDLRMVGDLATSRAGVSAATVGERELGVIVTLKDGFSFDDIKVPDVELTTEVSATMIVVSVPVKNMEALCEDDAVAYVSLGYPKKVQMKYAREMAGVDKIHDGTATGLDRAYTGAGVVVGIFDTGIDPNHIAFFKDNGAGESRVKEAYAYTNASGTPTISATTPDAIAKFTTDLTNQNHGTHCIGIAAGGYKGPGSVADAPRSGATYVGDVDSHPYYGVAYDADIVMGGGYLYDANIISGVTKVIEYAEANNKPAAINLSLGSLLGQHDGTSSSSQALAELGKRAIICIAAGNDAGSNNTFYHYAALNAPTIPVGFTNWESDDAATMQVWWSTGDVPATVQFGIVNRGTNDIVYTYDVGNTNGSQRALGGSSTSSSYTKPGGKFDEAFTASSYITFRSFTDSRSGKFVFEISHKLAQGSNSLLSPCLIVSCEKGAKIEGYADGCLYTNHGLTAAKPTIDGGSAPASYQKFLDGSDASCISSMATGDNILCVGAYTSKKMFSRLSGGTSQWYYETNEKEICSFSSYGYRFPGSTTADMLPHVVAPGSVLISALNSYYNATLYNIASASAYVNGKTYYWLPMQGTSMATPFTTGTMALLLEADPTLTIDDIKEKIRNTCYTKEGGTRATDVTKQWGSGGALDVPALMKEVIDTRAGIGSVFEDPEKRFMLSQSDSEIEVYAAGETSLSAQLYSVSGMMVGRASAANDRVVIPTSGLAKGIYVLKATGTQSGGITHKFVVK